MNHNPNKTITANSKGILISYGDNTRLRYVAYKSKEVADIQHFGKTKYQQLDKPLFNRTQKKLYSELLYGIKAYEPMEVMSLSQKDVLRINSIHKKTQFFLNRWKQEIQDSKVNAFFSALFPKSYVTKIICSTKGYDRSYTDRHSFKELGLNQETIASKLVEVGFLPKNFFQLV